MEATERGGALVVTIVLGPKIDTDGTMKSNTTTDFEASLQAPRKLQRVANMVYEKLLTSRRCGTAVGGLKTKLGELRKLAIADTLSALLVTLKTIVLQGLPPLPVEPVKSTIRLSQEPTIRIQQL